MCIIFMLDYFCLVDDQHLLSDAGTYGIYEIILINMCNRCHGNAVGGLTILCYVHLYKATLFYDLKTR